MPALLAAVCVTAYFGFFIAPGTGAGFTQDDLMNLYRAWSQPLSDLLLDSLIFFRFSPQYRPAGAMLYRSSFALFGFDPLPLHVACAVLLWMSIPLSYVFVRDITGSRLAGLLAAMLHSYHGRFAALIFNSGMCYDILCFLFYFAAFTFYVHVRSKGKFLDHRQTLAWCALFALALNSKEMAVTLPLMIGAYELIYQPPKCCTPRLLWRWAGKSGRIAMIGGAMTALFIGGRLAAEAGLLNSVVYSPTIRPAIYLDRGLHFLSAMLYEARWLTPATAVLLVGAGLVTACLVRNRALWLSAALMLIGILPVAFIERRGLEVVFIPTLGTAAFLAILMTGAVDHFWRTVAPFRNIALFAVTLGALFGIHLRYGYDDPAPMLAEGKYLALVQSEFRRLLPVLPKGGRILFIRDPFIDFQHGTTFMLRTLQRDPELIVDRLDLMGFPAILPEVSRYTHVVSFEGRSLRICDPGDLGLHEALDVQEVRCTPAIP